MSNLKDLTIVIPSLNREDFLKRTLNYWSGKEPQVVVLDSSIKPLSGNFLKSLQINILYMHLPNKSFQERLSNLNKIVFTKYCMLHADDEFFLPHGISKCIDEIETNDIICCLGRCLSFEFKDQKLKSNPWLPLHTSFEGYALLDDSPINRLSKHLHPYLCSTVYAVTKTSAFLNNISCHVDDKIENLFFEITYEISSAFQGKSKVINTLSWLRSNENTAHYINDRESGKRKREIFQIILESEHELDPIILKIAKHLHKLNSNYSEKILVEILRSVLRAYAYHADFSIKTAHFFQENKILNIKNKSPLKRLLGWRPPIMNFKENNDLYNSAKKWKEVGVDSDLTEISFIQNNICDFHNKFNLN